MNTITSKHPKTEIVAGPGATWGGQVGYVFRNKWEVGLSGSYRKYAVEQEKYLVFEDQFDPLTGYPTVTPPTRYVYQQKMPAIAITPYVNRHFGHGKADWFVGIRAGYVMMLEDAKNIEPTNGSFITAVKPGNGLTAGLIGGCAYRLWKNLSVRGELGVDGVWLKDFSFQGAMTTFGLQYCFR